MYKQRIFSALESASEGWIYLALIILLEAVQCPYITSNGNLKCFGVSRFKKINVNSFITFVLAKLYSVLDDVTSHWLFSTTDSAYSSVQNYPYFRAFCCLFDEIKNFCKSFKETLEPFICTSNLKIHLAIGATAAPTLS